MHWRWYNERKCHVLSTVCGVMDRTTPYQKHSQVGSAPPVYPLLQTWGPGPTCQGHSEIREGLVPVYACGSHDAQPLPGIFCPWYATPQCLSVHYKKNVSNTAKFKRVSTSVWETIGGLHIGFRADSSVSTKPNRTDVSCVGSSTWTDVQL